MGTSSLNGIGVVSRSCQIEIICVRGITVITAAMLMLTFAEQGLHTSFEIICVWHKSKHFKVY